MWELLAAIVGVAGSFASGALTASGNEDARREAQALGRQSNLTDAATLKTNTAFGIQDRALSRDTLDFQKQQFATNNYNSNQDRMYGRLKDQLGYIANILNGDTTLKNNLVTKLSQQGVSSGLQL